MLKVPIKQQPDDTTCGPTCLHAVYEYYGAQIPLEEVIRDVYQFAEGGTLGSLLAIDALQRGYAATIYSYDLRIFDPTWFELKREQLKDKLQEQMRYKRNGRFRLACEAYIRFLELGGQLRFEDLRAGIIRKYMRKGQPVIAGLSATYLYQSAREYGELSDYDDVRGEPSGHFVVLRGYDMETGTIDIADPIGKNPFWEGRFYRMKIARVINAILLGIVTYDANLIIITPPKNVRKQCAI